VIAHILDALVKLKLERIFLVVGHRHELLREALSDYPVTFVLQKNQLGTGHATKAAAPLLKRLSGSLLVILGDTPLITPQTLRKVLATREKHDADHVVLTTHLEHPKGYGRILRDPSGKASGIVEDKDATSAQRKIREVNTGFHCFRIHSLLNELQTLSRANASGEYYLTDLLEIFYNKGRAVLTVETDAPWEVRGINDREELAQVEHRMRSEIAGKWMRKGVSILNPATVYIDASAVLKPDTTIHPGVLIEGRSRVGSGCVIGSFSHLQDATLGDNVQLDQSSIIRSSTVPAGTHLSPFTYLQDDRVVERGPAV